MTRVVVAVPAAPRRSFDIRAMRPGLSLASLFALLLVIATIRPDWLASGDPLEANARYAFQAPSAAHLLGTDENGRDVLTRVVYGARPSLLMGVGATAMAFALSVTMGFTAGLGGKIVDALLMRFVDVLLAIPPFLLAIVIVTLFGQGLTNLTIAIAMVSMPHYTRLVRAQTAVVRGATYVEAARTLGIRPFTLIHRHIVPNTVRPVLILVVITLGEKIGFAAALSFLGFGAPPPSPEWGAMLSVGRDFLGNAWWLTAVPGLAIVLSVLSISVLARELMRRSEARTV